MTELVLLRLEEASLLQYSIDYILRRTVLGKAIIYIADPAADADFRESDFCHVVTHGSGNPV